MSGHLSVYWYQQILGQGPQLLFQYYNGEQRDKGEVPNRFSARQSKDYRSELNLSALEPGDSALYLCASSVAQPSVVVSFLCKNFSCLQTGRGCGG